MFVMRQLKGLKLPQIILTYVNILSAKFDFEKVKQNEVRGVSRTTSRKCVILAILAAILDLHFLM